MQRLNAHLAAPEVFSAIVQLEKYLEGCGLDRSLLELVKTRASQINGCAYCIHMHTRDARSAGESEARLYLLDAWRETDIYTRRERAALAWTEAVTLISETRAPDELYNEARVVFSESELVILTAAIGMINLWNRMSIAFRAIPQVRNDRHAVTQ
jgi:AhpD family alkylhydroperoxidase